MKQIGSSTVSGVMIVFGILALLLLPLRVVAVAEDLKRQLQRDFDLDAVQFNFAGVIVNPLIAQEFCPNEWQATVSCIISDCPEFFMDICPNAMEEVPNPAENEGTLEIANADISTNSWNDDACKDLVAALFERRRLEDAAEEYEVGKCPLTSPDDGSRPPVESEQCLLLFIGTCLQGFNEEPGFEDNVEFCDEWVRVYTKCKYNKLTAEQAADLERAVNEGRGGKGIIFTFAAGNEYHTGETINMEGYLNSRYTIAVGAVGQDLKHASYSSSGSGALFISGPGGDDPFPSTYLTAKPEGGCEDSGVGTSYATPAVAGGIAVVLQANPNLGWRDVQGILASTAQKFDAEHPTWTTNAAGFHHSPLFGFGVMDVWAAVEAAKGWTNLGPEIQASNQTGVVNLTIGDTATPASSSLMLEAEKTFITESVIVEVLLDHVSRGDVQILLESPQGTTATLLPAFRSETSYWLVPLELTSVVSWGENPSGKWTLTLIDKIPGNQVDCVDMPFSSVLTEEGVIVETVSCDLLVVENVCSDGGVNETVLEENIEDYGADYGVDDTTGVSFDKACCACGGGVPSPDDRVNKLVSWKVTAYGHDEGSDSTVTSSPANGTSGSSQVPGNGTTPNGTTAEGDKSTGCILDLGLIVAMILGTALAVC